jgi:hypothetical protein
LVLPARCRRTATHTMAQCLFSGARGPAAVTFQPRLP